MASIVLWDRTSTLAAQVSPILALCSGLITWLVCAQVRSGAINVTTLGDAYNSLAGDCVALGIGAISVVLLTFLFPAQHPVKLEGIAEDVTTRNPDMMNDEKSEVAGMEATTHPYNPEETADGGITAHFTRPDREPVVPVSALTPDEVRSQRVFALTALAIGVLGFLILLPFTLYGTGYTFSLGFFKAYVVIAFIWIWTSAIICVVLPLWESRTAMYQVARSMFKDVTRAF